MELDQTPNHGEKIIAQQVNGTVVLLSLDHGEYYALNEIGGRVWELCDGTRNVANVIKIICDEYDAPPDTIKADVLELLGDLASEKILV